MIKTITKFGNSQVILFNAAFMEKARLKIGDRFNVTLHESGTIILTPAQYVIKSDKAGRAARRLIATNSRLFKRMS
jgi:antitoxin component of MazEF toxin-antitoxin module